MCGASFAIPQIAGLFLLSRQIDKEIRFNEFIDIIKNPQMVNKDGMNYINANEIIKQVEKNRKEKIEKRIFFHDQKSDACFKDESSGVYTVPTQELDQETLEEQSDTQGKNEVEQTKEEVNSINECGEIIRPHNDENRNEEYQEEFSIKESDKEEIASSKELQETKNIDVWMNRFSGWYGAIDRVSQNVKAKFVKMKSDIVKAISNKIKERNNNKDVNKEQEQNQGGR